MKKASYRKIFKLYEDYNQLIDKVKVLSIPLLPPRNRQTTAGRSSSAVLSFPPANGNLDGEIVSLRNPEIHQDQESVVAYSEPLWIYGDASPHLKGRNIGLVALIAFTGFISSPHCPQPLIIYPKLCSVDGVPPSATRWARWMARGRHAKTHYS